MADQQLTPVRKQDIDSLAEKLDALAATMTDGERAALARVILNAASATRSQDTSNQVLPGFAGPLASNLAIGSNFRPEGQGQPIVPISPGQLHSKERVFFRGVSRFGGTGTTEIPQQSP